MRQIAVVIIGLLFVVGCNTSKVPKGILSGTVTYKGQPVNGGSLQLFSSVGAEGASIPLGQDGTFRSSGVIAGEYTVVIEPSEGSKGPPQPMSAEMKKKIKQQPELEQPATIPIPEKYKKRETSDLKITVNKSGETKVNLELKD